MLRSTEQQILEDNLPFYAFLESNLECVDKAGGLHEDTYYQFGELFHAYGNRGVNKFYFLHGNEQVQSDFVETFHCRVGGWALRLDCQLMRFIEREMLRHHYIHLRQLMADYNVKLVVWEGIDSLLGHRATYSLFHASYIRNVLKPKDMPTAHIGTTNPNSTMIGAYHRGIGEDIVIYQPYSQRSVSRA